MLDKQEEKIVLKLLKFIPEDDLLSLASTVVNKHLKVETTEDARNAIVDFSASLSELLKRKKVKREALFQCLAAEGIPVSVTADKSLLIEAVLKHCQQSVVQVNNNKQPAISQSSVQLNHAASQPNVQHNYAFTSNQPIFVQVNNNEQLVTSQQTNVQPNHAVSQPNMQPNHAVSQPNMQPNHAFTSSQQFGEEFCAWFYDMLNTQNGYGVQHFFVDCQLDILFVSSTHEIKQESHASAQTVCQRLCNLIVEEQLRFNPNICPTGVHVQHEPHGLSTVHCAGTVQQCSNIVALYEQHFGLVRDIQNDNNWRIKLTKLKIGAHLVNQTPTLELTQHGM